MEPSYGASRAVRELSAIFGGQWANGMLPQIRFVPGEEGYRPAAADWGVTPEISGPTAEHTSGITQPPIMGLCALEAYRKLTAAEKDAFAPNFIAICEGLEKYHAWLLTERDPWGENLVVCLHPWETGTDNSPAFDPLMDGTRLYVQSHGISVESFGRADTAHVSAEHRPTDRDYYAYFGLMSLFKAREYDQAAIIGESPFLLQDVLFNALFAVSLDSLASLWEEIGAEEAGKGAGGSFGVRAARNRERSEAVAGAMRAKLWHEEDGLFYSYDCRGNRLLRTPTVSSLVPLMGGIAQGEQARRLLVHLSNPAEFWTFFPVPSTSVASPEFNPLRYWSGPSWPVTNWLVLKGLLDHDEGRAQHLRESTLRMVAEEADMDTARHAAMSVLEMNSIGEAYTTPSRRQYAHAWLWDSAIVAASWPLVKEKPVPYSPAPGLPRFWEYYEPVTGEPLGAPLMSWTASLFLELDAM